MDGLAGAQFGVVRSERNTPDYVPDDLAQIPNHRPSPRREPPMIQSSKPDLTQYFPVRRRKPRSFRMN